MFTWQCICHSANRPVLARVDKGAVHGGMVVCVRALRLEWEGNAFAITIARRCVSRVGAVVDCVTVVACVCMHLLYVFFVCVFVCLFARAQMY